MAIVRLAREGDGKDAGAVAEIYRPYVEGGAISFEVEAPGAAEFARRIEAVMAVAPWLVATGDGGEVLGYAYASRHRDRAAYQWAVDVGIYLRGDQRRRGLGRLLYQTLLPLLRLQGFYTAHAGITLPNADSVGLHEAMGFVPVGVYPAVGWKLGAWHDVGWWRLPLQERPPTPAPPLPLSAARALPAWPAGLRD